MRKIQPADQTIFYLLDQTIRLYRRMAESNLADNGFEITIDQWLVLDAINSQPGATQSEIAHAVFKEPGALTKIISSLEELKYIKRKMIAGDRRKVALRITQNGRELLDQITRVIDSNRQLALNGISVSEQRTLRENLNMIYANCKAVYE